MEQDTSKFNNSIEHRIVQLDAAEPPPEVVNTIHEQGLEKNDIEGWLAVPSINPPLDRLPIREIQENGMVNATEVLEPLLGNKILDETLRTIDVLNGCGHHCDVCLADSVLPSRMFSLDSLKILFSDQKFLNMLQPDSIRFGSSGDILDHPKGVEIAQMALDSTQILDEKRMATEDQHHQIKIFTNYRPNLEKQLDQIIKIAQNNPDRFRLIISLPFNKKDNVNAKFMDYIEARPELFADMAHIGKDGLLKEAPKTRFENIGIQDVRHPRLLFMTGRVLSKSANAGRVSEFDEVETDGEIYFENRGYVKTLLNPDALWLMIYATPYESHTNRVFTPLNKVNLETFSHLPYHPDFPTPPNWPGKVEERSWQEVRVIKAVAKASGKKMKSSVVIN
ncbi:MAG: hypothetical protein ABII80_01915 [bacterium]